MNKAVIRLLLAMLGAALLTVTGAGPAAAQVLAPVPLPLELYQKVPVPGRMGRIDHFSGHGLQVYFSILGSNGVGILNWFDGRVVGFIPGVPEPQGVLYAWRFHKIFAASASGKVYIFNSTSRRLEKSINFGADADDLRWDPVHHLVLVAFGEKHGGIASINAATNRRVGPVLRTGSHPEGFQIQLHGPMLYANCPHAGREIEAINRDTGRIDKWLLHGASGNYAMALDEADHRLFTVTRNPPMLIVFNTETGAQVAAVAGIVGESDDVYFDSTRKRIYVIGAQGYVSVVQQIGPDRYGLIANVPTEVGARTGYWSARDGVLYVGVQAEGDEPAQIWRLKAEDY